MTIAAGFVCMDGIVLCADTQETITGYTKNSTEKIRQMADQGLCVAITGAGETELIETVGERIQHALFCEYSPKEMRMTEQVRDIIQQEMSSAFRRYIAPYAAFPRDDRPGCDLLIVVTVKNEVNNYECLFKASGTTVRQIEFGGDCVGTGVILAKSLMERFCDSFADLDELVLAMCYVMSQTKKWVDGCGGNTDLVVSSYKRDIFGGVSSRDIEALEKQFEFCEKTTNLLLTDLVNPHKTDEWIEWRISHARKDKERAIKALYGEESRLLDMLKRMTRIRPIPSMLSESKTSGGSE
jgi:20S proteasome alpha/beta subunit